MWVDNRSSLFLEVGLAGLVTLVATGHVCETSWRRTRAARSGEEEGGGRGDVYAAVGEGWSRLMVAGRSVTAEVDGV